MGNCASGDCGKTSKKIIGNRVKPQPPQQTPAAFKSEAKTRSTKIIRNGKVVQR